MSRPMNIMPVRRRPMYLALKTGGILLLGHCVALAGLTLMTRLMFMDPTAVTPRQIARATQAAHEAAAQAMQGVDRAWPCIVMVIYGIARVVRYHPLTRSGYHRWLTTTPWRSPAPLPLGPLWLTLEDAVPLGLAALLSAHGLGSPMAPLTAFAVAYCAVLLISQPRWMGAAAIYAILFLAPSILILWTRPWWALAAVLAAMAAAAQMGIARLLKAVPWDVQMDAQHQREVSARSSGEWQIGPVDPPEPVRLRNAVLAPIVVGWMVFCAIQGSGFVRWDNNTGLIAAFETGVLFTAVIRWSNYCSQYQPPISTWGRLWTGRWIIPGYDYVLVAPLCTFLVGIVAPALLWEAGTSPAITISVPAVLVLACALMLPPTRRAWQLTGHHRMMAKMQTRGKGRRERTGSPPSADASAAMNQLGLVR